MFDDYAKLIFRIQNGVSEFEMCAIHSLIAVELTICTTGCALHENFGDNGCRAAELQSRRVWAKWLAYCFAFDQQRKLGVKNKIPFHFEWFFGRALHRVARRFFMVALRLISALHFATKFARNADALDCCRLAVCCASNRHTNATNRKNTNNQNDGKKTEQKNAWSSKLAVVNWLRWIHHVFRERFFFLLMRVPVTVLSRSMVESLAQQIHYSINMCFVLPTSSSSWCLCESEFSQKLGM